MSWTDNRVDQLKSLWEKGKTASQIAGDLGGVSRNAVIGKAHRLGLQSRPSPVHHARANNKESASQPRAIAASPVTTTPLPVTDPVAGTASKVPRAAAGSPNGPVPGSNPPAPPRRKIPAKPSAEMRGKVGMLELTDKICKWPLGHPGEPDFHFCGEPVNQGFPYCQRHCAVAYQAPRQRSDRPPARGGWYALR